MSEQKKKVIGIVGGMGPEAGLALGTYVLKNTPARTDQEHLSMVLMSYPEYILDRSEFLLGKPIDNPAGEIWKVIQKLELAGAEVIGMACNTAHAPPIFELIQEKLLRQNSDISLLNMPEETCRHIKQNYPQAAKIGVMSSNGTYHAKIYTDRLKNFGFEPIVPCFDFQNNIIHRLIYDPHFGIKANPIAPTEKAKELLNKALRFFKKSRTELIILGCTEIPLILPGEVAHGMVLVNSSNILAKALVKEALAPGEFEKTPYVNLRI